MAKMQFDFDGLITLLAENLYSEKKVFIRELVQNAHDSIVRFRSRHKDFSGRIDIYTRPHDDVIIFRDNGIGMSQEDLVEFLSSIGKSGTRIASKDVAGLIGQFGIGFLSGFLVANHIEVRTRKAGEQQAWLWTNSGSAEYDITETTVGFDHGAEVTLRLKSIEQRGLIHPAEVRKVVCQYADMLMVEIYVDEEGPVNQRIMPWEKPGIDDEMRRLECMLYLEKTQKDSVLEAIPVNLTKKQIGVEASGLLYISKTRFIAIETPRNVRIFQKRMFLCENAPDVLPKWAMFVNGVLDAPTLTPTAARDSFIRDAAFEKLRDTLGSVIIDYLDELHTRDPDRFREILRYQNLNIKAACDFHDEFRKRFIHLLLWKTNTGSPSKISSEHSDDGVKTKPNGEERIVWRTLTDIRKALPQPTQGELQVIPCFTTRSSAIQYFQMADAAGRIVIDASGPFEDELLSAYSKMDGVRVAMLHVDVVDDPNVFRRISANDAAVERLANVMSQTIRIGDSGMRLKVDARRFDPPELEAVIRTTERTASVLKAIRTRDDPNASADMREMADDLIKKTQNESVKLTINAANSFIRDLAQADPKDQNVLDVMSGVYNNAILFNEELVTAKNAKIFHDHFARLMELTLRFVMSHSDFEKRRREWEKTANAASESGNRVAHRIFFLMTPFEPNRYGITHQAVRIAVEDHWHCQLFMASDRTYDDRLLENIRILMDRSDAFIAEVSEANPNVMFELGAVFHSLRHRPVILLRRKATEGEHRPNMPADLAGLLYVEYDPLLPAEKLADIVETEMRKKESIASLLKNSEREHYLSPRVIQRAIGRITLDAKTLEKLADKYPTREAWHEAVEDDVASVLDGADRDFASVILARMIGFQD